MLSSNIPPIAGLILAGGRGERMGGVVKANLDVGGIRLLDRVAAPMAACSPLLVAHGHMPPELLRLPADMQPVADPIDDIAGPLAGLAGAISVLRQLQDRPEFIVTVAVDTPFLPPDYLERLALAIGDSAAAIAAHAGQRYPTNAIWRIIPLLDLPDRFASGEAPPSLKSLALATGAIEVPWPDTSPGNPFANINTPADLAAAQAHAAAMEKPSS